MTAHITLTEAATLLGVTKETLRNWDRSGKLKPVRNPANNYRKYLLQDVQALKPETVNQQNLFEEESTQRFGGRGDNLSAEDREKSVRKLLSKLHKIVRDTDANSSIVERFDEVTKLLFLKLLVDGERHDETLFKREQGLTEDGYATNIRNAFCELAEQNNDLFPQKFRTLRLSNAAIVALGSALNEISLANGSKDVKGYAYEEMIRNTFDKGDHQQFFTPTSVVEFMVGLVEAHLHGIVADPACGTGGFLVEVAKRGVKNVRLTGLEIDERLAWVSGINLFVHNAPDFETRCLQEGGTLGSSGRQYIEKFDVILTNPPFGSDFADREELDGYVLGRGKTSRRRGILFLERSLALLKEGGLMAIVIDEGVLSLPSAADVRDLILKKAQLLAVISLPETTFMPYATVSTSILLLRRQATLDPECVTFYARAENIGRKPNGDPDLAFNESGVPTLNNELPTILATWRKFEHTRKLAHETENVFLAKSTGSSIFSLRTENRLDFRFHHPARRAAEAAVAACEYGLTQLGELCAVRNEVSIPSIDFADQIIPYTGLANIESYVGLAQQIRTPANSLSSAVKRYCQGDILFAKMRPGLRKVTYVDWSTPGYTSAECIVLTVRESEGFPVVDPILLSILLRSDFVYGQIIHLTAGIGRPRITLKDLLNIKVPIPPRSRQAEILEFFYTSRKNYEKIRLQARKLEQKAIELESLAVASVANGFISKGKDA